MSKLGLFLKGVGGGTLNSAFSIINAGFKGTTSLMKLAIDNAIQYQKEGIGLARTMGMSLKEAQAYTAVLTQRASDLGFKYGIAAEEVKKIQTNLSDATGRALMLNDIEAERMVQINKLVGSNVSNQFTSEMVNGLGAQVSSVEDAIAKSYSTAAKSGLNAAKFSEKVAQNLSMANRLSFKNGVDGIIKMTALSEKLGINMQSVESAAGQFLELDKAIENAAHMQMLGGSAAVNFGNPLTAAYEANYDPEAFAKRMSDSLASYATFDKNKGYATINGMNMDFVRSIAKAMGISTDDASKMAKKNAEVNYKKNAYGATLGQFTQEQQDFILNKSYIDTKTGHLMINDVSGKAVDISKGQLNDKILEEISKFEGMSDSDIMQQQALSLTSIDEKLAGLETSIVAEFAKGANKAIPNMETAINKFGSGVLKEVKELAPKIGDKINELTTKINENMDSILTVMKWIGGFLGLITANFGTLLILFTSGKILKFLANGPWGKGWKLFTKGNKVTRAASAAAKSVWGGTKAVGKGVWNGAKAVGKGVWNGTKAVGKGVWNGTKAVGKGASAAAKSIWGGTKTVGKMIGSNAGKLAKVGGTAFGAVLSAGFAGMDINKANEGLGSLKKKYDSGAISKAQYESQSRELKNQKNEAMGSGVGAVVGGLVGSLGGPIGTAVGAVVGDFVGKYAMKFWNNISDGITNFWTNDVRNFASNMFGDSQAGRFFNKIAVGVVDSISTTFDSITTALSSFFENMFGGIGKIFTSIWGNVKTIFGGIWDIGSNLLSGNFSGALDAFGNMIKSIGKNFLDMGKGLWQSLTAPFVAMFNGVTTFWNGIKNIVIKAWNKLPFVDKIEEPEEKHANGGIVGGNLYQGDRVVARLNSGEMVLNKTQQSNLFTLISSAPQAITNILTNKNDVKAKPVGEKEYIYTPKGTETSNVNGNTITVKDFNINLSGTLKLDAGNLSKNVDMNALLNDYQFISALKNMIKSSINSDMNGGRFMNDLAVRRGQISSHSII